MIPISHLLVLSQESFVRRQVRTMLSGVRRGSEEHGRATG